MQILNKNANVRDVCCFRVSSNGKICELTKEQVENFIAPFNELRRDNKSVANIDDLAKANILAREKRLTRIRKLEEEQRLQRNAGFTLISSVTVVGALIMGLLIFMLVKMIVVG